MKDLLEAGVHFGHQTKRWNPKMKEYIFGERNGIYIIDLNKTVKKFRDAEEFVTNLAADGKTVLFVWYQAPGAGRHGRGSAEVRMYFVNQRWLGGLLHQLQHNPAQPRTPSRPRSDGHGRPLRHPLEKGNRARGKREAQAAEEPRRDPA
jgi:ribosomal protein S2